MIRSTNGFCHGLCGAEITSLMPMFFTLLRKTEPYIESRSLSKYFGTGSSGKAPTACWTAHRALGFEVTLKWTTVRRLWRRTTRTNKMLKVAVGTVKKSIEHLFAWLLRKVLQDWDCFAFSERRGIRLETVRPETSSPSRSDSPWILGAPQPGFAVAIFLTRSRISRWMWGLSSVLIFGRLLVRFITASCCRRTRFWVARLEIILSFIQMNAAKLMSIFIMKIASHAGWNLSMISAQTSFCERQNQSYRPKRPFAPNFFNYLIPISA